MQDRFLTAAHADSKLRKFRENEMNAQKQKSIFAIVAGLSLLALVYISSFAVQS